MTLSDSCPDSKWRKESPMSHSQPVAGAARRARRSDATENRERILDAARSLLQEDGEVSMAAIARRAGVGQGTLYRNFTSREVLVMEIHHADVGVLVRTAGELLATRSPWDALERWLIQLADFGRTKRGMTDALQAASLAELASEGYGPIIEAIDELLTACRVDGRLREGVEAQDVLLLVGFLWRMEPDQWAAHSERLLQVVLAGLRVR
jgi:AcrR family transcriptional regulator